MDAPPATESEERPASPSAAPSSAAAAAAPLDSPALSEGGPAPGTATAPALDLPRSSVRKTVKAALAGTAPGGGDVAVSKEALGALGECAKIFLHYITSTANDAARDGKRQTISPADIEGALTDAGFEELAAAAATGAAGQQQQLADRPARSSTPGADEEAVGGGREPPAQKRRLISPLAGGGAGDAEAPGVEA